MVVCAGVGRGGEAHLFAKTTWDSGGGKSTRGQMGGPAPHERDAVATARIFIGVQATTPRLRDCLPLLLCIRQIKHHAAACEGIWVWALASEIDSLTTSLVP